MQCVVCAAQGGISSDLILSSIVYKGDFIQSSTLSWGVEPEPNRSSGRTAVLVPLLARAARSAAAMCHPRTHERRPQSLWSVWKIYRYAGI